ncbi:hypothetical protein NXS19_008560 [Fusarium pseudograminearum]|nr:hypothetical protein NXS19_008560 [Fusarium pseudograminearum]
MSDDVDSIVKGASTPTQGAKDVAGSSPILSTTAKQGDPLHHTPSSPSMIYLNLLILEASLRAQFLELRARKRHHTFFLTLLSLWITGFGWALFLAPREDGRGVGGSIYWAVEGAEKVCFMGGIITAILVWATGIWERGIRWPRRCSSYRYVEPTLLREVEKELQITSDTHPTLLLLLAKPFSATFRENWELYRTEYWEKENERRALLRQKVKERDHQLVRAQYPWTWWFPGRQPRRHEPEKTAPHPPRHITVERERRRRGSSVRRASTSSTRSPTPAFEEEQGAHRRSSSGSASKGRKRLSTSSKPKRPSNDSRSVTPDFSSPLARESSANDTPESGPEGGKVLRSSSSRSTVGSKERE